MLAALLILTSASHLPAAGADFSRLRISLPDDICMGIRSNLLYDACGVPQLGLEVGFGPNLSVTAGGVYAWWGKPGQPFFRHIQCGEITFRKYFSKRSLKLDGWHAGVFGRLLRYDICVNQRGWMSGDPRGSFFNHPTVSAGIEGGYTLSLVNRLVIDFTIGVGYLGGQYISYRRSDGHSAWTATHDRNFFGPVKAEIALAWIIGKGGKR